MVVKNEHSFALLSKRGDGCGAENRSGRIWNVLVRRGHPKEVIGHAPPGQRLDLEPARGCAPRTCRAGLSSHAHGRRSVPVCRPGRRRSADPNPWAVPPSSWALDGRGVQLAIAVVAVAGAVAAGPRRTPGRLRLPPHRAGRPLGGHAHARTVRDEPSMLVNVPIVRSHVRVPAIIRRVRVAGKAPLCSATVAIREAGSTVTQRPMSMPSARREVQQ
jgi:hypothetical protein